MSPRRDELVASDTESSELTSTSDVVDTELLSSLNVILALVSLPRISHILDATPNLLIALYESLHQKRIPLVDRSTKSHTSFNSRVKNVKLLIGTIAHEADISAENAARLGEIDPLKVCQKDEDAVRGLLWVLVRIGILNKIQRSHGLLENIANPKSNRVLGVPNVTSEGVVIEGRLSRRSDAVLGDLHKSLERRRELVGLQTFSPRITHVNMKAYNWIQDLPSSFSTVSNLTESNDSARDFQISQQKRCQAEKNLPNNDFRLQPEKIIKASTAHPISSSYPAQKSTRKPPQTHKPSSYPHAIYNNNEPTESAEISPVSTLYLEHMSARIMDISNRLLPLSRVLHSTEETDDISKPITPPTLTQSAPPQGFPKANDLAITITKTTKRTSNTFLQAPPNTGPNKRQTQQPKSTPPDYPESAHFRVSKVPISLRGLFGDYGPIPPPETVKTTNSHSTRVVEETENTPLDHSIVTALAIRSSILESHDNEKHLEKLQSRSDHMPGESSDNVDAATNESAQNPSIECITRDAAKRGLSSPIQHTNDMNSFNGLMNQNVLEQEADVQDEEHGSGENEDEDHAEEENAEQGADGQQENGRDLDDTMQRSAVQEDTQYEKVSSPSPVDELVHQDHTESPASHVGAAKELTEPNLIDITQLYPAQPPKTASTESNLIDLLSDPISIELPSFLRAISPVKKWAVVAPRDLSSECHGDFVNEKSNSSQSLLGCHLELSMLMASGNGDSASAIPLPDSETSSINSSIMSANSVHRGTQTDTQIARGVSSMEIMNEATSNTLEDSRQPNELDVDEEGPEPEASGNGGASFSTPPRLTSPTGSDSAWMDYCPIAPEAGDTNGKRLLENVFTSTPKKDKEKISLKYQTAGIDYDDTLPDFDANDKESPYELSGRSETPQDHSPFRIDELSEELSDFHISSHDDIFNSPLAGNSSAKMRQPPLQQTLVKPALDLHRRQDSPSMPSAGPPQSPVESGWETESGEEDSNESQSSRGKAARFSPNPTWGGDSNSTQELQNKGMQAMQAILQNWDQISSSQPSQEESGYLPDYNDDEEEVVEEGQKQAVDNGDGEDTTTATDSNSESSSPDQVNGVDILNSLDIFDEPHTPIPPSKQSQQQHQASSSLLHLSPPPSFAESEIFQAPKSPLTPIRPRRLFSTPVRNTSPQSSPCPEPGNKSLPAIIRKAKLAPPPVLSWSLALGSDTAAGSSRRSKYKFMSATKRSGVPSSSPSPAVENSTPHTIPANLSFPLIQPSRSTAQTSSKLKSRSTPLPLPFLQSHPPRPPPPTTTPVNKSITQSFHPPTTQLSKLKSKSKSRIGTPSNLSVRNTPSMSVYYTPVGGGGSVGGLVVSSSPLPAPSSSSSLELRGGGERGREKSEDRGGKRGEERKNGEASMSVMDEEFMSMDLAYGLM